MRQILLQWLVLLLLISNFIVANAATSSKTHKKRATLVKVHKKPHKKIHKKVAHKKSKHKHATKIRRHQNRNYMLGIASFYGENDGSQGQLMANGDVFDANDAHSAAHPKLPLGTKLMVTNLANGRTIYVEVRDRMPRRGRVIDLSAAAAKYLGMHHKGLTRVKLVKISDEDFEQKRRYLEVEDDDNGKQS